MSTNTAAASNPVDQWQSALGGKSQTEEPLSPATEESDDVVRSENSVVDDVSLAGETEDTLQDSTGTQEPAVASSKPEAKPETSEKEVITVTDETGRKRKVEIDYSNKDAIKRAYAAAAGMRKFQAERDQVIAARKELETKLSEREKDWETLESAFKQGPEALFDLLTGNQGAFKNHVQEQFKRQEFLKNASPDEVQAMEAREELERLRKESAAERKRNEEFRKKIETDREQAETKSLESRVLPVFDKYRFADRLGDSNDEQMFDEMLWNSALKRLEPYEEKGLDISPELVEREFKNVASAIRKRIGVQAQKQVAKTIETKKQEATENVQARVKSGYTSSSDADKLKDLIKSGDTGSIFKNWSSFSKILSNNNKR